MRGRELEELATLRHAAAGDVLTVQEAQEYRSLRVGRAPQGQLEEDDLSL